MRPGIGVANRVVGGLLRSPAHRVLSGAVCLIEVRGRSSGRRYRFPVQYAESGESVIVWPGQPEQKRWWRNLRDPAPVTVWLRGRPLDGTGAVLGSEHHDRAAAAAAYAARYPKVSVPDGDPLVRISLASTEPPT